VFFSTNSFGLKDLFRKTIVIPHKRVTESHFYTHEHVYERHRKLFDEIREKSTSAVFGIPLKGLSHQFESGYKWYGWKEQK
jgi:hypothetical protein